ncbi:MAG: hypothetical protein JWN83_2016 [Chitinophagaceae bacterium]|nr:hypothetical protein [Chitinophagaceae bacterium]
MQLSLTDKMKELLKECYQRELDEKEPCNPATHEFVSELLVMGLATLKPYTYKNGERKAAYFLTDKGRKAIKGK